MEKKQEIPGKDAEENERKHQQETHGDGAETLGDTAVGGSKLISDKEKEGRIKRKEDWLKMLQEAKLGFQDVALKAGKMEKLLKASPFYWNQYDGSTSSGNEEKVATSATHREENVSIRECPECLRKGQTMNLRHIRRECPYGGVNVIFDPISIRKAPKRCWNCGRDHLARFCNLKKR